MDARTSPCGRDRRHQGSGDEGDGLTVRKESRVESLEETFDDANGDLAVGDLESAVEKYRRCVELDPQFFDGWHALGMALMKLGRFEEAIGAGKRAVELRPNDQIGW